MAVEGGWNNVKLYFMMGLPTETMEDIDGIADLGIKLIHACRDLPPRKTLNITLGSTSCFVPTVYSRSSGGPWTRLTT